MTPSHKRDATLHNYNQIYLNSCRRPLGLDFYIIILYADNRSPS